MIKQSSQLVAIACVTSLALGGCDNAALNRRITEFDAAVVKSSAAIQTYYEQLNDLERNYYFDGIRFDPGPRMALTSPSKLYREDNGKREFIEYQSGLLTRFNESDIEVRIAAVRALGKFGKGLALLASSDAPERAAKSIEGIGTEIQSIDTHIKSLSGDKGDDFTKFSGPISIIGGVVTKYWMKKVQNTAVVDSIKESKEAVTALIGLLEEELTMLDANVLKAQSQKSLNNRIDYYNEKYRMHQSSPKKRDELIDDSKRKAFLDETQKYATQVRNLQSMEPQNLVKAMKDSYSKLIDLVENPRSPLSILFAKDAEKAEAQQEFDDLTKSIGAFLEDAERVAKAVEKLKTLSTDANN